MARGRPGERHCWAKRGVREGEMNGPAGWVAGLSGGFGLGWCGFSFSISIFLFQTLLKPN